MNHHSEVSIFWFRRDLRLEDNHGLFQALSGPNPVLPIFIFDRNILDKLEDRDDARVNFIHRALEGIQKQLKALGKGIFTIYGTPLEAFQTILGQFQVKSVYTNHDYEPYAQERDQLVKEFLHEKGIGFQTFKDQVVFEKNEILTGAGLPYTVFTPYSKNWKNSLKPEYLGPFLSENLLQNLLSWQAPDVISLQKMNFEEREISFPPMAVGKELLNEYAEKRNFPSLPATSRQSVHLRFGTVSTRALVKLGLENSETWLNELIWREFYMNILWHFPKVGKGEAFKSAYDKIPWRNNEEEIEAWIKGKTGFPIVDAGMRELNTTGFMHNRVRMIVASFLVKHLLVDWRIGEAWFARKLLDFDLAANNGGWQWAAGSGCDAAPYFRVFNPLLQTQKFDPQLVYIKKWVPEYNDPNYLQKPIVQHEFARRRVLEVYQKALN